MKTILIVLGIALTATTGLALLYPHPWVLFGMLLILNGAVLGIWHEPVDRVRWIVGATCGNATELLCDFSGIWVHATRQWLDAAPFYIFLCYPILMVAVPRLLAPFGDARQSWREAVMATVLFAGHVALSTWQAQNNAGQLLVSACCLSIGLILFHQRRDLAAGSIGMGLGLLWEIPCTYFGSWRFPHPQFLGLVPYWLPLAYAVFFITLVRVSNFLAGMAAALDQTRHDRCVSRLAILRKLYGAIPTSNGCHRARSDYPAAPILEQRR